MQTQFQASRADFRWFLVRVALIVAAAASVTLGVNLAVDPLWFFSGNRLGEANYAFNERVSKVNQYLRAPRAYDCLILGSSRLTVLDAGLITTNHCFNLAVSGGLIGDILALARYLRPRSGDIRLVIVGVDAGNFTIDDPTDTIPDFVKSGDRPPGVLQSYLSIDSLGFSLRTLAGLSPMPRYYGRGFHPAILADAPKYNPKLASEARWGVFSTRHVDLYRELRGTFPEARFVGYVPPMHAQTMYALADQGRLPGYILAISSVSKVFDEFYDFSIPSAVTSRTDNTYDGSHYDVATNALIAETLNSGKVRFGMRVRHLEPDLYERLFRQRLSKFWPEGSVTNAGRDAGQRAQTRGSALSPAFPQNANLYDGNCNLDAQELCP